MLAAADPTSFNDKESITADPTDSRFVYAVWTRDVYTDASQEILVKAPTWFARTTNDGANWEPARIIYDPGIGFSTLANQIVVLPDGTLVNFFLVFNDTAAFVAIIRSTDKGVTWSQPVIINTSQDIGVVDVETGEIVRSGVPNIAVDQRRGTLYVVWPDSRFSGGLRDGIVFSRSTDGGFTWSAPLQVNQAPNVQAFAPSIAVARSGRVAITYYDFRKDTPDPATLLTNYWRITTQDGGHHWHEIPLAGPFDIRTAPVTGLGLMVTDYEGLVATGESFAVLFVLANSGNILNRTDVFTISKEQEGDTMTNGHVENNTHPLTLKERILLRHRERRPPKMFQ